MASNSMEHNLGNKRRTADSLYCGKNISAKELKWVIDEVLIQRERRKSEPEYEIIDQS